MIPKQTPPSYPAYLLYQWKQTVDRCHAPKNVDQVCLVTPFKRQWHIIKSAIAWSRGKLQIGDFSFFQCTYTVSSAEEFDLRCLYAKCWILHLALQLCYGALRTVQANCICCKEGVKRGRQPSRASWSLLIILALNPGLYSPFYGLFSVFSSRH